MCVQDLGLLVSSFASSLPCKDLRCHDVTSVSALVPSVLPPVNPFLIPMHLLCARHCGKMSSRRCWDPPLTDKGTEAGVSSRPCRVAAGGTASSASGQVGLAARLATAPRERRTVRGTASGRLSGWTLRKRAVHFHSPPAPLFASFSFSSLPFFPRFPRLGNLINIDSRSQPD